MERSKEIFARYLKALDDHLLDLVEHRATEMLQINGIAEKLHMNATYLSNAIKQETGRSACSFFQDKIIAISKSLLEKDEMSITAIAYSLTYDPSNFTKFFKSFTQQTPGQYRASVKGKIDRSQISVTVTKGLG